MPIENRDLAVGTRLAANYKKQRFICTVVISEKGGVDFVLEDGTRHKSPSAAGSRVMAGQACNGWRFWSLESDLDAPKAETATKATTPRTKADSAPKAPKPERKPRSRKTEDTSLIRLSPHQEELGEGETRWWCNGCMASFVGFGSEKPTQCPNGHRADDPELTRPVAAAVEQAEATQSKEAEDKPAKARRVIYRVPNQHGTPAGKSKYFCSVCMKGFLVDAGDPAPQVCPEGHSASGEEASPAE